MYIYMTLTIPAESDTSLLVANIKMVSENLKSVCREPRHRLLPASQTKREHGVRLLLQLLHSGIDSCTAAKTAALVSPWLMSPTARDPSLLQYCHADGSLMNLLAFSCWTILSASHGLLKAVCQLKAKHSLSRFVFWRFGVSSGCRRLDHFATWSRLRLTRPS